MVASNPPSPLREFVGGILLCLTSNTLHAVTFHVATDGNDGWSGRQAQPNAQRTTGRWPRSPATGMPLRPAQGARAAGRAGASNGRGRRLSAPRNARLRAPGQRYGHDADRVSCGRGARPVLSGGRAIAGFKRGEGPLWVAEISDAVGGKWQFRQLFVNGRRACRRTPNEGYLHVEGLVEKLDPKNPKPGSSRSTASASRPATFMPGRISMTWRSWCSTPGTRLGARIAAVDEKERVVRLAGMPVSRLLAWDPQQRYYVENTRDALDSPGEWYLDRQSGKLYYWPLAGEDPAKAEVVAPVLQELVRFDGKPDSGAFRLRPTRRAGVQHADWTLQRPVTAIRRRPSHPAISFSLRRPPLRIERCEILPTLGRVRPLAKAAAARKPHHADHIHDLGTGAVRVGQNYRAQRRGRIEWQPRLEQLPPRRWPRLRRGRRRLGGTEQSQHDLAQRDP